MKLCLKDCTEGEIYQTGYAVGETDEEIVEEPTWQQKAKTKIWAKKLKKRLNRLRKIVEE